MTASNDDDLVSSFQGEHVDIEDDNDDDDDNDGYDDFDDFDDDDDDGDKDSDNLHQRFEREKKYFCCKVVITVVVAADVGLASKTFRVDFFRQETNFGLD